MTIKFKTALLAGLAAGALISASPAGAMTINLHDIGGVGGSQAELGFQIAAAYWESVFSNNATVELNVGYSDLGPNILGSTGSSLLTDVRIEDYYGALAANGNSALDAMAVANLSPLNGSGGVTVTVPGYTSPGLGIDVTKSRIAPDDAINQTMAISTANAKALGVDFGAGFIDGQVQFSNTFAFDFDPTDGISPGTYDFIGVAVHEIGHALGFISAADDFDYYNGYTGPVDNSWWGYSLDMFRYSAPGVLDWSPVHDSYFSLDGGVTAYGDGYFSTGSFNGDGWQASHWKEPDTPCANFRGIMNPYICNGIGDAVTGLDLALFDAIGWNLNEDAVRKTYTTAEMFSAFGVPEPSVWVMMIAGFGMAGSLLRRRRLAA